MSWFTFSPRAVSSYLREESGSSLDEEKRSLSGTSKQRSWSTQVGGGGDIAAEVFYTPTSSTRTSVDSREENSFRSWSTSLDSVVEENSGNRSNALTTEAQTTFSTAPTQTSVIQVQTYWSSRSIPQSACGLSSSIINPRRVTKFQPVSGSRRPLNEGHGSNLLSLEIDMKMPSNFRGTVSITSEEKRNSSSSLSTSSPVASSAAASSPFVPNFHHRRESFLYRASSDNSEGEASPKWHAMNANRDQNHSEDVVVTPFAQILQTLRRVRNNYMIVAKLPPSSSRTKRITPERDESGYTRISVDLSDEQCRRLAVETLDDLEWSLEQLENVQIHKSVSDLATNKFRRLLSRELNQFAESSKAGSQISDYICNTFLDVQKDIDLPNLKSEDSGAMPHQVPASVQDHCRQMSVISGLKAPIDNAKLRTSKDTVQFSPIVNEELKEAMIGINNWGFDVFKIKELTSNRPLACLTYTVLKERNLLAEFSIPDSTLINYLTELERHYRNDNSYHNNLHAADVMQSSHFLASVPSLQDVFTQLEVFAVIYGAAIHDVDHPGVTNQYLINSNAELAIMYNDVSVLENHHLALAFKLLQTDGCDIFSNFSAKSRQTLRRMVIDIVLATDMSKHMSLLADLKTMVETKGLEGSDVIQLDSYNDRIMVLQNIVHCSDLSNPTKPLCLYRQWTDRIMEEFFRQGDIEKKEGLDVSPMCDRLTATVEKSQVGFIDYIVHPLWETWADLVFPDCQGILDALEDNRQWYQSQLDSSTPQTEKLEPERKLDEPEATVPTFSLTETDVYVEETLPLTVSSETGDET